jgi:peptidoglycan/LPS O-acetylase OafA/YrhL
LKESIERIRAGQNADISSGTVLRAHMHELDTLRGIAVLLVLFFHGFGFAFGLGGLSGLPRLFVAATLPGWTGINLFFVLSGFLISGILIDTKQRPDYYRRFYYRRALRILPLYYAVLCLLAVLCRTGLTDRSASWGFLGISCIYLSNLSDLFGVPMQYGVLWTLAIEEHFYLLWPSVVRRLSAKNVATVATSIFVSCPLLRFLYCLGGGDAGKGYTWLYADGLALGALLACVVRGTWGTRSGVRRLTTALLGSSLILLITGWPFGILFASRGAGLVLRPTVLNLFFGGVMLLALLLGTSPWKGIVNGVTLRFFGEISYGVYLLHMLIFDITDRFLKLLPHIKIATGHFEFMVLRFCLGAGTTVGVAYLSRWHFEELFLKLKNKCSATTVSLEQIGRFDVDQRDQCPILTQPGLTSTNAAREMLST